MADIHGKCRDIMEATDRIDGRFRDLWDALMGSDDGVSGEVYGLLCDLGREVNPYFVREAAKQVDATDNRFYIKGGDA